MLQAKNFKHKLSTEMAQYKRTQRELNVALEKISKLEISSETKEILDETSVPMQNFQNDDTQPQSLVSLIDLAR
jgi:hypothetical protein